MRDAACALVFGGAFMAGLGACALAISFDGFVELPTRGFDGESTRAEDAPESTVLQGAWTYLTALPIPPAWPSERQTWAFVYDSAREKVVLWGGVRSFSVVPIDDLWEWDPKTGAWTDRTPTARPASWPSARSHCAAVYDSQRNKLVLFGGNTGSGLSDETWEYDGATGLWENRTPAVRPASWPSPRTQMAMAFDVGRRKTVMFSGYTGPSQTADTWEWDGNAGTWTLRTTTSSPSWGVDFRMAYDGARGKVMHFGPRYGAGAAPPELWEWDGNAGTWTNLTPSPFPDSWPPWRASHGLAYDATRGKLVLFGGEDHKNDVWEYEASTGIWRGKASPDGGQPWPSGRDSFGMAYDEPRGRSLVFGGNTRSLDSGASGSEELWAWKGK